VINVEKYRLLINICVETMMHSLMNRKAKLERHLFVMKHMK